MWTVLQDEVLVLLAAQRFYIEHISDSKFEKLDHFVRNWLSEEMLQKHEPAYYVEKVTVKLQALVYDILPSTTAVFSYAIGSRKLSANEQFSVGAQTAVSLLQTTQIIPDVCFITDHVAYASSNETKIV